MKKQVFIFLLSVAIYLASGSIKTFAASVLSYQFGSQGDIIFTNDTADTSDDVIFRSSDIYNLAAKCQ